MSEIQRDDYVEVTDKMMGRLSPSSKAKHIGRVAIVDGVYKRQGSNVVNARIYWLNKRTGHPAANPEHWDIRDLQIATRTPAPASKAARNASEGTAE